VGLKLVTAPADLPLTVDEVKMHLREDSDDQNDLILLFLETAVSYADGPEGFLGRALIDQTWDLYLDGFPNAWCFDRLTYRHGHRSDHRRSLQQIQIPLPPLIEVVGVFYSDSNGDEQEFDAANYTVDDASEPGRVVLNESKSWPTPSRNANSVRVRFRAGYLDNSSPPVANVPPDVKAALLLYVGSLYLNREEVTLARESVLKLPWGAEALLRKRRKHLGMA
jgi:uncharacterized phiE125 gp8 family phage protein